MLLSGATAHYRNGSSEPKNADYDALPNAARSDDSIELGARVMHERNTASHPSSRVIFDPDTDDNGDDSYWENQDVEEDENERDRDARVRLR